jgi:hypothetical protein
MMIAPGVRGAVPAMARGLETFTGCLRSHRSPLLPIILLRRTFWVNQVRPVVTFRVYSGFLLLGIE